MTSWDFPCADPVDIDIDSWSSGSVAIAAEPTDTVTVEVVPSRAHADLDDLLADVRVSFDDGRLQIVGPRFGTFRRWRGLDLTIKAPAGSRFAARTASADVSCVGVLGALIVQTASGDVTAATVTGEATVQTASGDVAIAKVGADATISTASGDIQLASVGGSAHLNTASGDVSVGECQSSVTARTASGDVDLGAVSSGNIGVTSASGDLAVAVVPGIAVYLDLASTAGSIRSELDADEGTAADAAVEIKCRTLSGDIRIRKARPSASRPASTEQSSSPTAGN